MIRNPEIQFESPEKIKQFQQERMKEELEYLGACSPFYKRMFAEKGIDLSRIKYLEDLQKIPVTTKHDLQAFNKDFICVPKAEIIDYVTSSGTLGDPISFVLTSSDLDRLGYNQALSFSTAGFSKGDILQLMTTIGRRSLAGMACFMGARELGCGMVRVGNGLPELQWDTIHRVEPNGCIVIPSFLIKLMDYAEANSIDYNDSSLRKALCMGENLRLPDFSYNTLGHHIHERWRELSLYCAYTSTEIQTSFTECDRFEGVHLPPDLIIVELLDSDNNPVGEGEPGEVTITTIGVRGMPLLRFKTGDTCFHYNQPCSCGRNTPRLSPVITRKEQMIRFKGVAVYPAVLYDILDNIPDVKNYIVEVYTDKLGLDQILIKIGCEDGSGGFAKRIKDTFRSRILVAPQIVFEPAEYIARLQMPPMNRKPIKFVDLRETKYDFF